MNRRTRDSLERARAALDVGTEAATTLVVSLSFWTAVCLPVALAALLVAGIETRAEGVAFLALTLVETLALVGGRGYAPSHGGRDTDP